MDIDIDFKTNFEPEEYFDSIKASRYDKKKLELVKHPAGIYFQNIPKDPVTNLSAIPYDKAEDIGYLKIDFLHLNLLNHFTTKDQIRKLSKIEPDWSLLLVEENVKKLFQIGNHYKLISILKPTSIIELADALAIIRPGKRILLDEYLKDKNKIRKLLYVDDGTSYSFKEPHAIAYATTIVLQLHLLKAKIL